MKSYKHVFFVGIKGVAMANLALMLKQMGKKVVGSDLKEEFITEELLKKNSIDYSIGFEPRDVPASTDLMVYSSAHGGTENPQVQEAKKRGIPITSQPQLLEQMMMSYPTSVAVCGSHGKTTTASLLSYALINLQMGPSYMVGASQFDGQWGGNYSKGSYFVVEADEYGINVPIDKTPKFSFLHPKLILCTNIDFDHPDVYKDLSEVKLAFFHFFNNVKLFLCGDDIPLMDVAEKIQDESFFTYGFSPRANFRIIKTESDSFHSKFTLAKNGKDIGQFAISLFGDKNISNAAGVISVLLSLGFNAKDINTAIRSFTGAKRRFEKITEKNKIVLLDDYAHHPHEIEATIEAARKRYPGKKLVLIFQPHTFSRSFALRREFARSLSKADLVFILPIFASSRENPNDFAISSHDIAKLSASGRIIPVDTREELLRQLQQKLEKESVIFTMGAGDVYKLKNDIMLIL